MLTPLKDIWFITRREMRAFAKRPIFLVIMFLAPLGFLWMFTSLMQSGLPTKLPAALVDEDDTHVTRQLTRILGVMEETHFVMQTKSFTEARQAMQRGEIYAIFRIPKGTTEAALTQRQPVISFYTNDTYYVAASLLMKDMRKMSEMAGLAMTRATMRARGFRDDQITNVHLVIVGSSGDCAKDLPVLAFRDKTVIFVVHIHSVLKSIFREPLADKLTNLFILFFYSSDLHFSLLIFLLIFFEIAFCPLFKRGSL